MFNLQCSSAKCAINLLISIYLFYIQVISNTFWFVTVLFNGENKALLLDGSLKLLIQEMGLSVHEIVIDMLPEVVDKNT